MGHEDLQPVTHSFVHILGMQRLFANCTKSGTQMVEDAATRTRSTATSRRNGRTIGQTAFAFRASRTSL